MNTTPQCPALEDGDTIHRYVAGTLEQRENDAFEIHLLACEACQHAVREGAGLAAALASLPRPGRFRWRWAAPLGAAAAAAVAWLLFPSESALERLGRVDEVPPFEGVAVRADIDSATILTDRGMASYSTGDFGRAAELLSAAAVVEANPGVQLFRGIALIKVGMLDSAVAALTAALEPEGNPYGTEARFYVAKAWLLLGNADSALVHLAAIPIADDRLGRHAGALSDSIREVGNR